MAGSGDPETRIIQCAARAEFLSLSGEGLDLHKQRWALCVLESGSSILESHLRAHSSHRVSPCGIPHPLQLVNSVVVSECSVPNKLARDYREWCEIAFHDQMKQKKALET